MRIIPSTDKAFLQTLISRSQLDNPAVTQTVTSILADVKARGNAALFEYTQKFDHVALDAASLRVSQNEIDKAYELIDAELLKVIRRCAQNIRDFHEHQKERSWFIPKHGGVVGQMVLPLESVGVYVPGGTAAYPSSVLMNVIPAVVAGVGRIVMATPPSADESAAALPSARLLAQPGQVEPPSANESSAELPSARLLAQPGHATVHPAILVAAAEAGAHEIYKMGGAQAIGALAYGTQTIKKVDKITGPGNAYVAEAKRQVFGTVGIDS
ncbi:MAG: histidinol dehydrogenase, partial [Clostridia bacterium]|nr:histidinol dehydrogenase [Clostridia bacterium]